MFDMLLAPRRHLYATNIVVFFLIIILQKFITIFCIIEEKACKNKNCTVKKRCNENCGGAAAAAAATAELQRKIQKKKKKQQNNFSLVPTSMRKAMRIFGFGEGHFQIFVEEKQRYQTTMEARLNAADAELKLNPN